MNSQHVNQNSKGDFILKTGFKRSFSLIQKQFILWVLYIIGMKIKMFHKKLPYEKEYNLNISYNYPIIHQPSNNRFIQTTNRMVYKDVFYNISFLNKWDHRFFLLCKKEPTETFYSTISLQHKPWI